MEVFENPPMVLHSMERATVSPPRPTSLLLDMAYEVNNNMPGITNADNADKNRKKKRRRAADAGVKKFEDLYQTTGEILGQGSFGSVSTYRNILTGVEYAVKIIPKTGTKNRNKVLKEIEIFHHCKGQDHILQLSDYYEEEDRFYMVFEKMEGGSLLETIERRGHLTEQEASMVIRDLTRALNYLHMKGIAHRDLKPENILCVYAGKLSPVKICDFDLGSGVICNSRNTPATTPELLTPVGSAEYMAPEVVDVWTDQAWSYDKRCDLWSLGIIIYILLCGQPPFYGQCGNDCGWENGESCQACQDSLFECIQNGMYDFPQEEWGEISENAKDLIKHLLVKDPSQRYSAAEVLQHPWVALEGSTMPLATPGVLSRNNSVRGLEAFTDSANAYNRLFLRHLSISEAIEPATFRVFNAHNDNQAYEEDGGPIFRLSIEQTAKEERMDLHGMFMIGEPDLEEGSGSGSASDEEDRAPILWMGLSPPGMSGLAKRRSLHLESLGDSGDEEKENKDRHQGPPATTPVAIASSMMGKAGTKARSPPMVPSTFF